MQDEQQPLNNAHKSGRPLPWHVHSPYNGCDGERMQHSVWDDDGNFVCECDGEDEGYAEAVAICVAVNRTGNKTCANCGKPAACFGSYESEFNPGYACHECCGHGNEDGHCEPLDPDHEPADASNTPAPAPEHVAAARERDAAVAAEELAAKWTARGLGVTELMLIDLASAFYARERDAEARVWQRVIDDCPAMMGGVDGAIERCERMLGDNICTMTAETLLEILKAAREAVKP